MVKQTSPTDLLTGLPMLARWTFRVDVKRDLIEEFCHALEDVVMSSLGAYFYWPRSEPNCGKYRYDWYLKWNDDDYAFRLMLVFDICSDNDLETIEAYVLLGRPSVPIPQQLNNRLLRKAHKQFQIVLREAFGIVGASNLADYYPVFHIVLPLGWQLCSDLQLSESRAFASIYDKVENRRIIAFATKTRAFSGRAARTRATPWIDKLLVLLSVLIGQDVSVCHPVWPRNKHVNLEPKDLPSRDRVYPSLRRYRPEVNAQELNDASRAIEIALGFLYNDPPTTEQPFWRAIHAFASGIAVEETHPTLASVAYIASLSALSKSENCTGTVSCTKCGTRPQHPTQSEADFITDLVAATLHLDNTEREQARRLIRDVYSKQRSSYVHDAILRHSELKDLPVNLGRPNADRLVTAELVFKEDLHSLKILTQRALLAHVSDLYPSVERFIGDGSPRTIRIEIPLLSAITVSKEAVNIVMVPS